MDMGIFEKRTRIMTESKKIWCEILKISDPNFPMTGQAAKDILVAELYLKSIIAKVVSDQEFKIEDMTDFGRNAYTEALKMIGDDSK